MLQALGAENAVVNKKRHGPCLPGAYSLQGETVQQLYSPGVTISHFGVIETIVTRSRSTLIF